jgi:translation elongation factor EF-1alpha
MKKFVAIGHVDTGKSCLCGHLLYKCNFINEREMDKIRFRAKKDKMEKWIWSRVLDIYEEEMLKGKTHEFNLINFKYQEKEYQLIDTPGHKSFVRSMIDGISEDVNIAVVLISMKDNEFESSFKMGMLKEHLLLARATGIEHLIIVANKMDLIKWDKDDYQKKAMKVYKYVTQMLRWDKKKISQVPISAYDGTGLVNKVGYPEWYTGCSFIEILDNIDNNCRQQNDNKFVETDNLRAKIMIVDSTNLVTSGYKCLIHYDGRSEEIMISNIKRKMFLRKGEVGEVRIEFNKKIDIRNDTRIILRNGKQTIGFGKVIRVNNKVKNDK